MSSKYTKFLQRYRVFFGFIAAILYFIFSRPGPKTLAAGLVIAAVGIVIRGWACGHLRKERVLDVSGPYAHTRNPLYLGTFIIAAGFGVASGTWWLCLLMFVFITSIYFPVMYVEAEELESWLGEEYREYASNVPMLFPRLTAWKKSDRRFDFRLYLRHGEYQAAVGLFAAGALLAAKAYYFEPL